METPARSATSLMLTLKRFASVTTFYMERWRARALVEAQGGCAQAWYSRPDGDERKVCSGDGGRKRDWARCWIGAAGRGLWRGAGRPSQKRTGGHGGAGVEGRRKHA